VRSDDAEAGADVVGALVAVSVDATGVGASAAAMTSSLRMRPPTPVPATDPRSTPRSLASLRTIGVTYPEPVETAGAESGAKARTLGRGGAVVVSPLAATGVGAGVVTSGSGEGTGTGVAAGAG